MKDELNKIHIAQEEAKASIEAEMALVTKLEDFFSSDEFVNFIEGYQTEHANKFTDDEEQSIECYMLYQQYSEALEAKLDAFLEEAGVDIEQMFEAC